MSELKINVEIGIVCSLFNPSISETMLKSCQEELARSGVSRNQLLVSKVPGALEIPVMILKLIKGILFF